LYKYCSKLGYRWNQWRSNLDEKLGNDRAVFIKWKKDMDAEWMKFLT
jgi:hypothetical protein